MLTFIFSIPLSNSSQGTSIKLGLDYQNHQFSLAKSTKKQNHSLSNANSMLNYCYLSPNFPVKKEQNSFMTLFLATTMKGHFSNQKPSDSNLVYLHHLFKRNQSFRNPLYNKISSKQVTKTILSVFINKNYFMYMSLGFQ